MRGEWKQALLSPWFWVAALVMMLSCFGMSLPQWLVSGDWGMENRSSALQLSLMPIFFGGASLMFPFCASMVYAHSQIEEFETRVFEAKLMRSSIRRYIFRKVSVNFVAGGCAVSCGFLLHAGIWHLIAWASDPGKYPGHEIPFSADCIYLPWLNILHGLPILIWMALGMAFMGGIWATVSLAVSVWIPDLLVSISLPTFLYFVWNSQATSRMLGVQLPYAAELYNDALTWAMVKRSVLVNLAFLVVVWIAYAIGLHRRLHNA